MKQLTKRACLTIALSGLLFSGLSTAGQVVVRKSSESFDAFAVRDQVLKDYEWQEALRMQQQIQILQSLPLGCLPMAVPYRYFTCNGLAYRPYQYQNKELYIQIDQPNEYKPSR
ncbi:MULTISPECIES: hypothetical protein [Pseudomonadati]|uniref:Uncharacterized protein n=1 Tax=Shewanella aestuarii TaxID=1028752 RepID=A0ABT0L1J0_9GAMM|nr:hypothetical protein [Shewanella aestuarii]MCL1117597.1 hypothetical protein [Shewanella aestuarii]GGN75208.1 hypothetical protein GCM10009193_15110 [Shewanella aestuarii]